MDSSTVREAIKIGIDSADQGNLSEWDEGMTEQIQELGRKRLHGSMDLPNQEFLERVR